MAPGIPAGGDHMSLGTVLGTPLEPGERVLFFVTPNHARTKLLLVLLGILLAVVVFGIFVVIYGVLYDRWGIRFVAVTNHRILVQKGNAPARFMRLSDVVDVRSRGRGTQAAKSNEEKTMSPYWEASDAVVVEGTKGTFVLDASVEPKRLGPAIANAVYTAGHLDRAPSVFSGPRHERAR
jgi:hypothetical protein